jgi:hypothetical protein
VYQASERGLVFTVSGEKSTSMITINADKDVVTTSVNNDVEWFYDVLSGREYVEVTYSPFKQIVGVAIHRYTSKKSK